MAEATLGRLIDNGHRHIAISRPYGEINLGYVFEDKCRALLSDRGLQLHPDHILRCSPKEAGGYDVARQVIAAKTRPSAIVLLNEATVAGFYRGLQEAGLTPGRDIAVIGQHSPQAQFLHPTLTCFRPDLRLLGVALAETLLSTMPAFAPHYPEAERRRLWPMELIEGESDEPAGWREPGR